MELNTIDEIEEVIKAYKEGKEIEHFCIAYPKTGHWNTLTVPNFNFCNYRYRIKQKEKKKVKYYQFYCRSGNNIYLGTLFFKTIEDCKNLYDSRAFQACELTAIEVEED